jgi:hypothetical protein
MIRAFAVASLLLVSQAFAANDPAALTNASKPQTGFNCFDLRKAAQKLPVYASNISNRETTRTPEGGPYKRMDVICREMYCETAAKEDFKLVVDRNHPDANSAGYVRFPVVNVASEFAALSSAASEVRLLASTGACGASAISAPNMALVKYDSGASIQSDTFNFTADGRLTSWSRVLRDGTSQHMAFNADGTNAKN